MSETKCRDAVSCGATTRTATKSSKPFCSLAYLAKSTISNDIRIVNGQNKNNNNKYQPNVASTAKVTERCKSSIPTGASIVANGHDNNYDYNKNKTNGDEFGFMENAKTITNGHAHNDATKAMGTNGNVSMADIFGEINEEDTIIAQDKVDGPASIDTRRPWEMKSNYIKQIPTSLMTNGHGHHNGHNGLTSLSSKLNSLDCWDYTIELECLQGPQDLQLAAELGKTLLERNKELETLLKEHKNTIEEQEQEIVYLKKHTTALREVNDSRLKVYEQLEVGIQDLERANHRLHVDNTNDKKHIKSLVLNIETLELRCDDLNKQLDDTRQLLSVERRKNERLLQEKNLSGTEVIGVKLKSNDQSQAKSDDNENEGYNASTIAPENCSFAFQSPNHQNNANSTGISGNGNTDSSLDLSMVCTGEDNEDIMRLVKELETTKRAFMAEQQRCGELEEQLVAIIQENQTLQGRIAQNSGNEEMKSMQEELSILDEVRQGQMCSRCLRTVEDRATINDEQSSIAPTEDDVEDDDERSLLDLDGPRDDNASEHSQPAYRSSVSIKIPPRVPNSLDLGAPASPNPYRDLVEKYEALVKVQRASIARKSSNGVSLAEEFQTSGEFNQNQKIMFQAVAAVAADAACNASSNGDGASSCNGSMNNDPTTTNAKGVKDVRGRTPTEFSEAETSSSGFSDETSNKCTQTDDRPGYFLCSIGDGEDCKFSIYDDASPIDSRFRNRPEYRELFKEIFAVLKKAAENKEEGEKLPLLDDTHPNVTGVTAGACSKVPPVTPANEEIPIDFGDDTQSVISSAVSEQSFAMSECITKMERKTAKKHIIEKNQENQPPVLVASVSQLTASGSKQIIENGRVLTPLKREPLEYVSVGVGIKKKNRKKNRNFSNDRSESPVVLPSPPRFYVSSGKKRKDVRPFVESPLTTPEQLQTRSSRGGAKFEWNGNSMIIYNRSSNSPQATGSHRREFNMNGIEYRPSTVSQDLHKLKKLDLSYAEVLRRADACKQHHQHQKDHRNYQQHQQQAQQQQQQQHRRRHQH